MKKKSLSFSSFQAKFVETFSVEFRRMRSSWKVVVSKVPAI